MHLTKSCGLPGHTKGGPVSIEYSVVLDLYELLKWGPTSANSSSAHFVWVRSAEGKAKLAALASERTEPRSCRRHLGYYRQRSRFCPSVADAHAP